MIIREYAQCEECGQPHVLRIGIGSEPEQAHTFSCVGCHEEMGLTLRIGSGTTFGPNANKAEADDAAPIVNLHPSFVFSKDELHSPLAFPSLEMGQRLVAALLKERARNGLTTDLPPIARPAHINVSTSEEWRDLRATWSLTRNGKADLAERRMNSFMDKGAYRRKPASLADWLFQFAAKLGLPVFEAKWDAAFAELQKAAKTEGFRDFANFYGTNLSADHGQRYFDIMRAYFEAYGEFSQVHNLVASGVEVGSDRAAASTHFDSTRMFYGNAFEAFASNVETLAALNNLIAGRDFGQLATISLEAYQRLDKAGRFRTFEANLAFSQLCEETDSQLRNASHHGSLQFRRKTGMVVARAGKGGGNESEMGYATYLARCSKLFLQLMVLLRVELLIADQCGVRPPL